MSQSPADGKFGPVLNKPAVQADRPDHRLAEAQEGAPSTSFQTELLRLSFMEFCVVRAITDAQMKTWYCCAYLSNDNLACAVREAR